MGFRQGNYATVWSVEGISNAITKGSISIRHKNKNTGEYETDFNGFVSFIGTAAARKALSLMPKSRIKLGDVDVSNRYNKEQNKEYTTFKIFSFDIMDESINNSTNSPKATSVGDGEIEVNEDEMLPF